MRAFRLPPNELFPGRDNFVFVWILLDNLLYPAYLFREMVEEITQQLWAASEKKKVCRIHMKDEPLDRVVHPYGICQTSANKIVLVCWQALGFTNSRGEPGYRNLILEDFETVEVLESHFLKRDDFNPEDGQYKDWVYHI